MAKTNTWIIGRHAVLATLKTNPQRVKQLWCVPKKHDVAQQALLDLASQYGIAVTQTDRPRLTQRCGSEHHQGIAAQATPKTELSEAELVTFLERLESNEVAPLLLVLDQVQDPHNFGACLRTADAAGVSAVIVAKDNASPITPTVQKVASGAAETMTVFRVTNLARALDVVKEQGVWVVGTSDKAEQSLYQQNLTSGIAIVMGAEGKGLRKLTEKKCDILVSLPMQGSIVSSLNVSVATGICLYEVRRQQRSVKS